MPQPLSVRVRVRFGSTPGPVRAGRTGPDPDRPPRVTVRGLVPPPRIELEPEEVAGLIRGSRLLELRADTPPDVRRRYTETALTAMDALCGLADRHGTDAVWDALALVSHRELLAFATLMASELAETGFALAPPAGDGGG